MKTTNEIPKTNAAIGTIARVAIQCDCPDTGKTGCFLFTGESHRQKQTRVTPVYRDLPSMFTALRESDWRENVEGNCGYGFTRWR